MKRVLIRAGKTPFEIFDALSTLTKDPIGRNSGNMMFGAAAHKLFSAPGVQVDSQGVFRGKDLAAKINAEYDGFALPLANCFRPGFAKELEAIGDVIRKLRIPFVMVSGGAQVEFDDPRYERLRPIDATVKEFCAAVLDASSHVTVRGEHTADYLSSLGIRDVKVIGCPSLTGAGYGISVRRAPDAGELDGARVSYNVETSKDLMGATIELFRAAGAKLTYVPQDALTLEMLVWARNKFPKSRDRAQPVFIEHSDIREGRTKFFLDAATWIDFMRTQEFTFGPRIHGSIASILGGAPAVLVAHDLRTRELADFHGIPSVSPSELTGLRSPAELLDRADYSAFGSRNDSNVEAMVAHINANGFETSLDAGREADRSYYERLVQRIDYPAPVGLGALSGVDERSLIAALHERVAVMEKRVGRLATAVGPGA